MCNLNHSHSLSKDLKISKEKRTDDAGQIYHNFCQTNNLTLQNSKELKKPSSEKALNCKVSKNVERDNNRQRTIRFGHKIIGQRKRLQFALLPIMYKIGVMTTLLFGLTVLALKGLTIGVILLIFAFGNYFMKYHKHAHVQAQPIHLHVHSQDGGLKHHIFNSDISPGWLSKTDMFNHRTIKPYI